MSLTDLEARRRVARAFYERHLKPLITAQRSGGSGYFPLGPDPACETYYQPRTRRTMSREDFEHGAFSTPEGLARELERLWRAQGDRSLTPLAPAIGELARELRLSEAQTEEVSELIYVMF